MLPFLFVLTPTLLMDGKPHMIAFDFARTLFGIYVGTAAVVGHGTTPLDNRLRWLFGALSLAILLPHPVFAGAIAINIVASVAAIAVLAILRRHTSAERTSRRPQPSTCTEERP